MCLKYIYILSYGWNRCSWFIHYKYKTLFVAALCMYRESPPPKKFWIFQQLWSEYPFGPFWLPWAGLDQICHFGPFWAVWAIWAILGHSGPLGPFWAIWAILGHLGLLGHSGPFGPIWAILGNFGQLWVFLGHLGLSGPFSNKVRCSNKGIHFKCVSYVLAKVNTSFRVSVKKLSVYKFPSTYRTKNSKHIRRICHVISMWLQSLSKSSAQAVD